MLILPTEPKPNQMKFPRNIKVLSAVVTASQALCAATLLVGANGFAAPSNAVPKVAAPKVAIVTTTRQSSQPAPLNGQTFAALQPAAAAPAPALAPSAQTIYKLVDANGRTTYADSPMTGAQKVALPDLTIMDSQWPSTLANATAGNTAAAPVTATPLPAPITETANPPLTQPAPIAASSAIKPAVPKAAPAPFSMVPVGNIPTVNSAPVESAKLILASNSNASAPTSVSFAAMAAAQQTESPQLPLPVFEKPRADAALDPQLIAAAQRRRMLESELRQEESLVRDIRQTLAKEEAESANFRLKTQELAQALKKNITPSADQKNAKEALLAHFERKRLLQDELGARERTAEALREVFRAR